MNRPRPSVLVVGAGPTGLVLALWLKRLGVGVRIIDKTDQPGTTSRALAVQARTLEFYRPFGLADQVVERGVQVAALNIWVGGKHAARASLGDIGRGLSPFPYVVIFPQDQHEQLLAQHLQRSGVEVERNTSLLGFEERGGVVVARIQRSGEAPSECEADYIAGCDGAHSTVREGIGADFPGGTYDRLFYVADVEFHGPVNGQELHVALDESDFVAVFPMKGANVARLIGTVRDQAGDEHTKLTWNDVSQSAAERIQITVDKVHWFSTYRVHHRVAAHFRRGRAFLVGDAAHVHSPVGGQGMNTGIGDAVNLAWKLASVLKGRAPAKLLDSYEPERMAFATRLVATTDRVFTLATKDDSLARWMRLGVVPRVIPSLLQRAAVRRFLFQTVSQTTIEYRRSEWSEGKAGAVRGGDRLPWVAWEHPEGADNFAPLASIDWQMHVYGEVTEALAKTCAERWLPVHAFRWHPSMGEAGLSRDAAYLIRPDGYVALADARANPANLERYLDTHELKFVA